MLRSQSRQMSHAAIEGSAEPSEFQLLKEFSFQRSESDLEWHLQMADFDLALQGSHEGPSLRALGNSEVHHGSRPVLHIRLISMEEVRENHWEWCPSI